VQKIEGRREKNLLQKLSLGHPGLAGGRPLVADGHGLQSDRL
jgi:hypothetical protein